MFKLQKGNFIPLVGIVIVIVFVAAGAYFFGMQNAKQSVEILEPQATTDLVNEPVLKDVLIKVVDGDIVISENGEDRKLTEWGHNSDPLLSPSKNKIAYISKTEESFENEKKYQGYVPSSTNVWIINADGSNPQKITNHSNWIYRDNLLWLDEDRLLFTDGESSIKVYNLTEKSTKTVLGPEEPEGICVDACGAAREFFISPDKKYLLLLGSDSNGGILPVLETKYLNIPTLISKDVNQKFSNVDFESVVFGNDSVSFKGSKSVEDPSQKVLIDLISSEVSFANI